MEKIKMNKAWFFLLFFVMALSTDVQAVNFSWPGKGEKASSSAGQAEKLWNEARRAYGSADYAKVIDLTTQSVEVDPKFAQSYMLRGKARKDMGDVDNAFKDLDLALSLDPKLGEAYFIRAQTHEIMGEMEKAAADYKKGCAEGYQLSCQ